MTQVFNKDGLMDLAFTHWSQPGLSLWKNVGGMRFERVTIPEPQWVRGWGITAIDIDNDGWIDLAAVGERDAAGSGEMLLLRNLGDGRFDDLDLFTSETTGLSGMRIEAGDDEFGGGHAEILP